VQAIFAGYRKPDSTRPIGLAALNMFKASAESNAVPTGASTPADFDSAGIAYGHDSLRQSSTKPVGAYRPREPKPTYVGQSGGFASEFGNSDAPPGHDGGNPLVQIFSPRSEAGAVDGLAHPVGVLPTSHPARVSYGSARQSATPPNPSYPTGRAAECSPRPAMKNSDALSIMKAAMREQLGG
jgi:hypothetical protein